MASYAVDSGASKIVVHARSSVHDTDTVWDEISGEVEADPATLAETGATASFAVDMTRFDAGDWLKNRKLKKDFAFDKHPEATFELTGLRDVTEKDDGSFSATADGTLRWRGKEVALAVAGTGTVDDGGIDAKGTFDLDIKDLGLKAPRFLMFKVEDEVTVEVTLVAKPR